VDHLAVELTIEGVTRADPSHRLLFELGPDELAPGIYTLPVEHQCFSDCDNPDFTEDVVIEVVSVDDCLAAAFLEVPTFSCVEVLVSPCGGFVEPIL